MNSPLDRSLRLAVVLSLTAAVLVIGPAVSVASRHHDRDWVGTWTASAQLASSPLQINGQTLRQIVHTSLGGDRARVRLSNVYGTSDLLIGSAHVAISGGAQPFFRGPIGF